MNFINARIYLGKLGNEICIGEAIFRDGIPSKGELISFGKDVSESEVYEVLNVLYTPCSILDNKDDIEIEIFVRLYNWED